ncbi:MAG: efflux RND transporter periplasmic adaptor subunit [Phycisphaeraceae bacterium]
MATRNRYMQIALQILVVLLLVAVGVAAGWLLYTTRDAPERSDREAVGPLVETMTAQREDVAVVVNGHGTVEPRVQAALVPQVGGRVVAVHDQLAAGGFVEAGETIIEIEAEDYQLALDRAATDLAAAQAAEETAEAQIAEAQATLADAERELQRTTQLLQRNAANERDVERAQLAVDLAEAGLRQARSSLSTAQSQASAARVAMQRAEVDLRRTSITLPFDAVVVEEQVSVGQFVTAGQSLGRVYGTEAVEIAVPLDDREVGWLAEMPMAMSRNNGAQRAQLGSAGIDGSGATPVVMAEVTGEFFGRYCEWRGRVVRTEGQMDRQSRMVSVVVRVENPFEEVEVGAVPLMPGAFVQVAMQGRGLEGVIAVPRYAIHGENRVWVADDEGRLRVREVVVVRRERDRVFISEGVSQGEQVILSPIGAVTEGMRVRVIASDNEADAPAADQEAPDVAQ